MYKNSVINEKIHHSKWIKSGHIKMKNINRNLSDKKQIVSFWKTTTILSYFKFVCVCVWKELKPAVQFFGMDLEYHLACTYTQSSLQIRTPTVQHCHINIDWITA